MLNLVNIEPDGAGQDVEACIYSETDISSDEQDLVIDNCVTPRISNPVDDPYKHLIAWLQKVGILSVTNSLLTEYGRGSNGATKASNLIVIISHLQRAGRLRNRSKDAKSFVIPKATQKKLKSNFKDRSHLQLVLVSATRRCITLDSNFAFDVNNYPKLGAVAVDCPSKLTLPLPQ